MARTLTIGQAARATGVTPKTIRYYEEVGVLPRTSRSAGGYRQYGDREVERIRFVRRARGLGLSVAQLRELTSALGGDAGARVRPVLRAVVGTQLAAVRRRRAELRLLQRQLEGVRRRLAARAPAPRDGSCRCLDG
jgi:DNA-binding transcriptional MerR regulator